MEHSSCAAQKNNIAVRNIHFTVATHQNSDRLEGLMSQKACERLIDRFRRMIKDIIYTLITDFNKSVMTNIANSAVIFSIKHKIQPVCSVSIYPFMFVNFVILVETFAFIDVDCIKEIIFPVYSTPEDMGL